jgi:elongation factor Ts
MADIKAKDVMALRAKTGLSMMECKKALVETGGDAEAAEDFLRKKLKGKMETRTDRAAGEGQVAVAIADDHSAAAIVELRAETDFTAKNENFAKVTKQIAKLALGADTAAGGAVQPTDEMNKIIDEIRITTGENISIARVNKLAGDGSRFGSYVHHDGKTAALLQADTSVSEDVARDVCMHITAAVPTPQGVSRDDVPDSVIEKERKLAMEMAIEGGKNEEIAQKMVEGKINKLYSELALLEQPFVKDPDKKISDLVGGDDKIAAFRRWQVGEDATG